MSPAPRTLAVGAARVAALGVALAAAMFISEQIQQGVASGANDSFVLGRFEQHLRRFQGHVQDMLRD